MDPDPNAKIETEEISGQNVGSSQLAEAIPTSTQPSQMPLNAQPTLQSAPKDAVNGRPVETKQLETLPSTRSSLVSVIIGGLITANALSLLRKGANGWTIQGWMAKKL